jgi:formate hydrogenlyase subunit 3/multisubunit Na+/H+ antiporter MnhD subunit
MGIRDNHFLNNFFSNLSIISSRSTIISVIVYIVLAVIVIDTTLNQNPELRLHLKDSGLNVTFFIICGIIAIVGQFYIIQYVRQKSSQIRKKVVYLGISFPIFKW